MSGCACKSCSQTCRNHSPQYWVLEEVLGGEPCSKLTDLQAAPLVSGESPSHRALLRPLDTTWQCQVPKLRTWAGPSLTPLSTLQGCPSLTDPQARRGPGALKGSPTTLPMYVCIYTHHTHGHMWTCQHLIMCTHRQIVPHRWTDRCTCRAHADPCTHIHSHSHTQIFMHTQTNPPGSPGPQNFLQSGISSWIPVAAPWKGISRIRLTATLGPLLPVCP